MSESPSPSVTAPESDVTLVARSVAGDREAFGAIVGKYQSLICGLAYSALGRVSASEDVAQETFVTAWNRLGQLREPVKLRAWLCGIARGLVRNAVRRERHQPLRAAAPLPDDCPSPAPDPLPSEQLIRREEEAILWRALERIPDTYREPLVLYYREQKSVESVGEALGLSEDAVKQRLARGRKFLEQEVLSFVEGALQRTSPGKAFTLGVLAAVAAWTNPAKAAVLGASATKGSALVKPAGVLAGMNAIFGPVLMFLSLHFSSRLDRETAPTLRQRELVTKWWRLIIVSIVVFGCAFLALVLAGRAFLQTRPGLYVSLLLGLWAGYGILATSLTLSMRRQQRALRGEETAAGQPAPAVTPLFEYRSRCSLLGRPLVHIRLRGGLERGPVVAWIAAGDAAIGLLFAFGGVALAPVSFGGLAAGLVTLGGLAVGVISTGGVSVGMWAVGGLAVGVQAFGACAVAWWAAQGGAAVAREVAVGAVAFAQHANDAAAQSFLVHSTFFRIVRGVMPYAGWMNLFWLFPWVLWRRQPAKLRSTSIPPQ